MASYDHLLNTQVNPATLTPAQLQQWQQWQQQYQSWQQQYGKKYEETLQGQGAMGKPGPGSFQMGSGPMAGAGVPPLPAEPVRPPQPTTSGAKPPAPAAPPEDISEAEKNFDVQFKQWEQQFEDWKKQNAGHPDKSQYREYEKKWETWREQLLEKREAMRRKRLAETVPLPEANPLLPSRAPATPPPKIPPDPYNSEPLVFKAKPQHFVKEDPKPSPNAVQANQRSDQFGNQVADGKGGQQHNTAGVEGDWGQFPPDMSADHRNMITQQLQMQFDNFSTNLPMEQRAAVMRQVHIRWCNLPYNMPLQQQQMIINQAVMMMLNEIMAPMMGMGYGMMDMNQGPMGGAGPHFNDNRDGPGNRYNDPQRGDRPQRGHFNQRGQNQRYGNGDSNTRGDPFADGHKNSSFRDNDDWGDNNQFNENSRLGNQDFGNRSRGRGRGRGAGDRGGFNGRGGGSGPIKSLMDVGPWGDEPPKPQGRPQPEKKNPWAKYERDEYAEDPFAEEEEDRPIEPIEDKWSRDGNRGRGRGEPRGRGAPGGTGRGGPTRHEFGDRPADDFGPGPGRNEFREPDDFRQGAAKDIRRGGGPEDLERGPSDFQRGPDDFRRGPGPDDFRRGPGPDDFRRGPRPDDFRRGPGPDDIRRGPGPDFRRGPGPDDFRRGAEPDDFRRGPGPDDFRRGPGPENFQRGPGPEDFRRGPGPDDFRHGRHRPGPGPNNFPPGRDGWGRPGPEGEWRGPGDFRDGPDNFRRGPYFERQDVFQKGWEDGLAANVDEKTTPNNAFSVTRPSDGIPGLGEPSTDNITFDDLRAKTNSDPKQLSGFVGDILAKLGVSTAEADSKALAVTQILLQDAPKKTPVEPARPPKEKVARPAKPTPPTVPFKKTVSADGFPEWKPIVHDYSDTEEEKEEPLTFAVQDYAHGGEYKPKTYDYQHGDGGHSETLKPQQFDYGHGGASKGPIDYGHGTATRRSLAEEKQKSYDYGHGADASSSVDYGHGSDGGCKQFDYGHGGNTTTSNSVDYGHGGAGSATTAKSVDYGHGSKASRSPSRTESRRRSRSRDRRSSRSPPSRDRRSRSPAGRDRNRGRSRSPQFSRSRDDRSPDTKWDRGRNWGGRDRDRSPRRSRSPMKVKNNAPLTKVKKPEPAGRTQGEYILVEDLITPPGRHTRPHKLVFIMRGVSGSGKSFITRLIKERESENGGSVPRILSIDDYFVSEEEVETKDESGATLVQKGMKYVYDRDMESVYEAALLKAFRKTVSDGFFMFIIVDAVNKDLKQVEEMWSFAKQKGFQVYVCETDIDVSACHKRNIHNRTEEEISEQAKDWQPVPAHYLRLDVRSMLQSEAISDVEMEDVDDAEPAKVDEKPEEEEDEPTANTFLKSKWDDDESSGQKMDRLDGLKKKKPTSMEAYLSSDDFDFSLQRAATPGKKRVQWADIEERQQQEKMRAMGFVVGQTDWKRMMDPSQGESALTRTKYI